MTHEVLMPDPKVEKFAIDDVLGSGWGVTKAKFWSLLGVMGVCGFVAALVPIASFVLSWGTNGGVTETILKMVLGFLGIAITITTEIGMMKVFLMSLDGEKINADDAFKCVKYLPTYALAWALSRSAIALGYMCLIVPGIILQISFQFAGYFIVEKNMGPIAALKASWSLADGSRWQLLLLAIVNQMVNWFGFMCLFVGAIPAFMVTGAAMAATYRSLLANTPSLAALATVPRLSDAAVSDLLKEDSWPDHLKPELQNTTDPEPNPPIVEEKPLKSEENPPSGNS